MLRVLSHSRTPRPLTTHHTQVVCDRSGAGSSNNRDEVLVCEGDLIGKSREQSRSLYFWRDRAWLQS